MYRYYEQEIRKRLASDADLAMTALADVLYENQTPDERRQGVTIYDNKMGFTQEDAPVLTPLARKVRRTGELDKFQLAIVFNALPKYARQVTNYLNVGLEMCG